MLEQSLCSLDVDFGNYHLLVMGDLNARSADKNDFIDNDEIDSVPFLRDQSVILSSFGDKRTSCDTVCNSQGRCLLTFCKEFLLLIVNGRLGEDKGIGDYTYLGCNGKSVIDYLLLCEELFTYIKHFSIGERTESCHLPLEFGFNIAIDCQQG